MVELARLLEAANALSAAQVRPSSPYEGQNRPVSFGAVGQEAGPGNLIEIQGKQLAAKT
jgi:hypothetical protein